MTISIPSKLVEALQEARHVVVLTGAGISAESGMPTFREAQTGLWAKYDPQKLATPEAFRRNPRLVWEWYSWRRELAAKAEPNPGHRALVELERRAPQFTLITQNVDNLHARAGSQNIIELHGNLTRNKCSRDGCLVASWEETGAAPRCPRCQGLIRPDVVWFGEQLPPAALVQAFAAARNSDIFLSIGTSGLVQPAASLPLEAVQSNAVTVEVNPQPTPFSPYMTYVLSGPAGKVLPALIQAAWPR